MHQFMTLYFIIEKVLSLHGTISDRNMQKSTLINTINLTMGTVSFIGERTLPGPEFGKAIVVIHGGIAIQPRSVGIGRFQKKSLSNWSARLLQRI